MAEIFLKIVNMSISATWTVLAVILLRLLLKKAPKWIAVLLWGFVAVRLVCPFSIESVLSLMPTAETISPEIMMQKEPQIDSGVPIVNTIVNPYISESFAPNPGDSANPLQIIVPLLAIAWTVGMVGMLIYAVISYLRVKKKIGTAVLLKDNIYQSESVVSPFVLGIIKPKIYLPFNMQSKDLEHVIAHENAHIRRKDHLWKPLGFLLLAVYWFNPLMWLGYILLCRDIELACDEKVIKEFDTLQKADYSEALLSCSVNRRIIAACPLAFGEVGVKNRVKTILNYKKPAFWIVAVAIVTSIAVAVCFLTNPKKDNKNSDDGSKPTNTSSGSSQKFNENNSSGNNTSSEQSEIAEIGSPAQVVAVKYRVACFLLNFERLGDPKHPKKGEDLVGKYLRDYIADYRDDELYFWIKIEPVIFNEEVNEYTSEQKKEILKQRIDYVKSLGALDLVQIPTEPDAYYASLTAEMINKIDKKGDCYLSIGMLPRAEGYDKKIGNKLVYALETAKDSHTINVSFYLKCPNGEKDIDDFCARHKIDRDKITIEDPIFLVDETYDAKDKINDKYIIGTFTKEQILSITQDQYITSADLKNGNWATIIDVTETLAKAYEPVALKD